MKVYLKLTMFVCLLALFIGMPGAIVRANSTGEILDDCVEVLQEMVGESELETLSDLVKQGEGIVIFPSVVKAGLIVGGRYGRGILMRRDRQNGGWYGPNFVVIKGASWGLQAGYQRTALVLVIMNDRGMKEFIKGDKVTLGGNVEVAAGPVGRQTGVGTDGRFKAEIYSYSMSKGFFAGVSLEGAKINVDRDNNLEFWKKSLMVNEILSQKSGDPRVRSISNNIFKLAAKSKQ